MNWKTLSSQYITKHRYFTARKDKCVTPSGKIIEEYYVVEMPKSACALAITKEGEALVIRQYRYPIDEVLLELPGGFIDGTESPQTGMARELLEETGYEFEKIEQVGLIAANPGVLNNYTALFLATGGIKIAGQQLDQNEEIEVLTLPLEDLKDMFLQNKIRQSMHANCIFYGLRKMGKL